MILLYIKVCSPIPLYFDPSLSKICAFLILLNANHVFLIVLYINYVLYYLSQHKSCALWFIST